MQPINLSKVTSYGTTLEEELIRFVKVMHDGDIAANGVLIETKFSIGSGPAMAHFGSLGQDNVLEFWLRVVKILVDYPVAERMRIGFKEGSIN